MAGTETAARPAAGTIRYWAAAKAAAGTAEVPYRAATLADALAAARQRHAGQPDFARVLLRCSFLVDGHPVGLVTYFDAGAQRVFLHTEVRPEFEGRGLAGKIARFALDDVRAQGRRVVNFCPYLKGFLERNHDWDDIVDRPTPAILDAVRSMQG